MDRLTNLSSETTGTFNLIGSLVLELETFEDEVEVIGVLKGVYPTLESGDPYTGLVICQDQDGNFIEVVTCQDRYSLVVNQYDALKAVKDALSQKHSEMLDLITKLVPQNGNTADTCQKVQLDCVMSELDSAINSLGGYDLIPNEEYGQLNSESGYVGVGA